MGAVITESGVSLLFCLHFSFVLLSSFDSAVGWFAALSISTPYSRCLAFYFWLSFILLFAGRVAILSFIQVIYCGFEYLSRIRAIVCLLICITHASTHSAISRFTTVLTWKIKLHRIISPPSAPFFFFCFFLWIRWNRSAKNDSQHFPAPAISESTKVCWLKEIKQR